MKKRLIAYLLVLTMTIRPAADLIPVVSTARVYAEEDSDLTTEGETSVIEESEPVQDNSSSADPEAAQAETAQPEAAQAEEAMQTEAAQPEAPGQSPGAGQSDEAVSAVEENGQTETVYGTENNVSAAAETVQSNVVQPNAAQPKAVQPEAAQSVAPAQNTDAGLVYEALPAAEEIGQVTPIVNTEYNHSAGSEAALPAATLPEAALPEATLPEATLPEATLPEATLPESTLPESTLSKVTQPESVQPEAAQPDSEQSEDIAQPEGSGKDAGAEKSGEAVSSSGEKGQAETAENTENSISTAPEATQPENTAQSEDSTKSEDTAQSEDPSKSEDIAKSEDSTKSEDSVQDMSGEKPKEEAASSAKEKAQAKETKTDEGEDASRTSETKEKSDETKEKSDETKEESAETKDESADTQNEIAPVKPMVAAVPQSAGKTVSSGTAAGSGALLNAPGDSGSDAGEEPSLLQTMIAEALAAAGDTLMGKVVVTLKKNTIYTGDVSVDKENLTAKGQKVGDDFELGLEAEDAGEDGLQADGSIQFTGVMTIKGIAAVIKGMVIKGAVSVEKAKLNYFGTTADDDVLNVTAGKDAEVEIQTGEGADNVKAAAVNGGKLTTNTGADSDKVKAEVGSSSKADIQTGTDDDQVDLKLKKGAGEVSVYTGADDDTVSITDFGGTKDLTVQTSLGNDTVTMTGRTEEGEDAASPAAGRQISVDLGEGMDEAVVDLSMAAAAKNIAIKGSEGSDRLHVTGYLDMSKEDKQRIQDVTPAENTQGMVLNLHGTQGLLTLTTKDVIENITDDLKNKQTIYVYEDDLKHEKSGYTYSGIQEAFANYVFVDRRNDSDEPFRFDDNLIISRAEDAADQLPMTSFILDARAVGDDGKQLILNNARVTAEGLQLVLRGKTVSILGESRLKAGMLRVEAYSGTESDIPIISLPNLRIPVDVLNISDQAYINIDTKAELHSEGDIIIQAKAEQDSGLITLMPGMNLVDLKVAKAVVDVKGSLYAGIGPNEIPDGSGRGSVSILASTNTTAGLDADGNAYNGLPLAVTMASANAVINIGDTEGGASISAVDSIRLSTKTRLEVSTRADSANVLPVAVAVSVLTADSRVSQQLTNSYNVTIMFLIYLHIFHHPSGYI